MDDRSIPLSSEPTDGPTMAGTLVPNARFLEVRQRRQRVRLELARPPAAPAPPGGPLRHPLSASDRETLDDERCGTRSVVETARAEGRAGRDYERAGAVAAWGARPADPRDRDAQ
jgi:hypothetical protein